MEISSISTSIYVTPRPLPPSMLALYKKNMWKFWKCVLGSSWRQLTVDRCFFTSIIFIGSAIFFIDSSRILYYYIYVKMYTRIFLLQQYNIIIYILFHIYGILYIHRAGGVRRKKKKKLSFIYITFYIYLYLFFSFTKI